MKLTSGIILFLAVFTEKVVVFVSSQEEVGRDVPRRESLRDGALKRVLQEKKEVLEKNRGLKDMNQLLKDPEKMKQKVGEVVKKLTNSTGANTNGLPFTSSLEKLRAKFRTKFNLTTNNKLKEEEL